MEEYPEEIRTPPVGLVAVVGCQEHHGLISSHMQAEQPPINTLALPDFSTLSMLLLNPAATPKKSDHLGILKRDWLPKHRTRIPSVVAALFSSEQVSGDPTEWLRVSSLLDNLKSIIRPKNIKLAIVVVLDNSQSLSQDDAVVNEERMSALRKRAEVDSKYFLKFEFQDPSLLQQSLSRLASTLAELSFSYYRDQGRRIKTRIDKKNSPDLNVRYCFKVAVYAEFRRDWAEALRYYEDAYHTLREMVGTSTRLPPIQRLVQIKTVAEQLHFKLCTLLLHGGKITEAISWFRQHAASYRKLVGAPQATFLHWEWMSRQFLVFAELLETSLKLIPASSIAMPSPDMPLIEWEFQPAYYYQLAASCMKEKQTSLKLAVSILETTDQIDSSAEVVVPSICVGEFARLLEHGDDVDAQPLMDEEFTHYAIVEGKKFQDSFEIIALLRRSYESFSNLKAQRMAALCGFQMAVEYFSVDDLGNAKELLDNVASLYRQEGWINLLWEVLGYLRECSRRSGTVKDFVEYSLEMAAIPVSSDAKVFRSNECSPAGPATLSQRETILREVLRLVGSDLYLEAVEESSCLKFIGENPLHIEIDLVSPLRLVLLASVAFHEQIIKPGVPALITFSLLSQLPLTIDVDQLEVQFNQSECNFTIINSQKSTSPSQSCGQQQGHRVESASSLSLVTNKWLRLTYSIESGLSGKLECLYIVAKIGAHLIITCRAESPASMDDLPLWKFEDRVETFPTKDPTLDFSGQKVVQVEEADPQVDLILGATGPALIGESFVVPVIVTAKGHGISSGELKINLVDVRGGGLFSPRESEPFSMDSHHVELLGVTAWEGDDESQAAHDDIKKIQQSFGLVSVPLLKVGQSWTCNVEIRWHRPKPIMLFVSLGYFPDSNELASQKVHVHKSLQIEGKSAFLISHHFMLPFRQEPLLLSKIKSVPDSEQPASLPVNLSSLLIIIAKNCSEVPLQLQSMSIELDKDLVQSCQLQCCDGDLSGLACIVPGEQFKRVFSVMPSSEAKNVKLGSAIIRWRRFFESEVQSSTSSTWVSTKHILPDVNVELPPLVVHMECPPYASLGDAFTYSVKIKNQTHLLQEIKFSLADAQSFVVSGSQSDTIFVLPNADHIIGYKMVPLASGVQLLPRVTVTSLRHSASFQPSVSASTVFVYPCRSRFKSLLPECNDAETLLAE